MSSYQLSTTFRGLDRLALRARLDTAGARQALLSSMLMLRGPATRAQSLVMRRGGAQ